LTVVAKGRLPSKLTVVSGIAPTTRGGTGRLLRSLMAERDAKGLDVRFIVVGNRANVARSMVARHPLGLVREVVRHYGRQASRHWLIRQPAFIGSQRMLVLHPQEIGTRWLTEVIRRRGLSGLKTELFVLDASFFCVRSYNHVSGEPGPCRRCLDEGLEAARRLGCRPFPIRDRWALVFGETLQRQALLGQVVFWTQTAGHASLVRQYAGSGVSVRPIGLWTDDFDDLDTPPPEAVPLADVVYHGTWLDAKGGPWALRLAEAMPERRFLFPCPRPRNDVVPSNAIFETMSWDTGLAAQVRCAPLTVVPSLWTAPIEAALVKSIAHAPATAVISFPDSFAAALPAGLVLHLPPGPREAADVLRRHGDWTVDPHLRRAWVREFTDWNRGLLQKLLEASPS